MKNLFIGNIIHKRIILFFLLQCFLQQNNLTFSANDRLWQTQIDFYKHLLSYKEQMILDEQYQSFNEQRLLSIAHPEIKAISIIENDECLIDIRAMAHDRILMLPDPDDPFASPDCNSGFVSACYVRKTLYEKLEKLLRELDELATYFGYQSGQVLILVFEGLRDIATQKMLFDNKAHEIMQQYPEWSEQQVITEASKWISPVVNNIPVHSTGGAIDIRLYDKFHDQFVDMGKFGVIWGANAAAPTFSTKITPEQMKNRLWLYIAALKVDLINYPYEFWHFSTGDRYAVYWLKPELMHACYGTKIVSHLELYSRPQGSLFENLG